MQWIWNDLLQRFGNLTMEEEYGRSEAPKLSRAEKLVLSYDYPYGQPEEIEPLKQNISTLSRSYLIVRVKCAGKVSIPLKRGPELVIFNQAVYKKTTNDFALVGNDAVRTEACYIDPETAEDGFEDKMSLDTHDKPISRAYNQFCQQEGFATSNRGTNPSAGGNVQLQGQLPLQVANDNLDTPLPGLPRLPPVAIPRAIPLGRSNTFSRVPIPARLQMPPRAIATNGSRLQYLFDLPANQRAGVAVFEPRETNYGMIGLHRQQGGRQPRARWSQGETQYLMDLLELAMRQLNRTLRHEDFKAITEALHRQFHHNPGYVVRGFNTIHSHVIHLPAYIALVNQMFP